jgi:hypothetical protein
MPVSKLLGGLLLVCAAILVSSCVQLPTEKQEVADLRPRLSFSVPENIDPQRYRVVVDNLDMGALADYSGGQRALKVLSGTHVIRIQGDGQTIHEERIYLGDGATRQLQIGAR